MALAGTVIEPPVKFLPVGTVVMGEFSHEGWLSELCIKVNEFDLGHTIEFERVLLRG